MIDLLSQVENYANKYHEGDYSLLKTKENLYACFGLLENKEDIKYIHTGVTLEEVLQKLINDPINYLGEKDNEDNFDLHSFEEVYAIKLNDKSWLPDDAYSEKGHLKVFSTEKKAIKEVEYFKKIAKYAHIDFKVIKERYT